MPSKALAMMAWVFYSLSTSTVPGRAMRRAVLGRSLGGDSSPHVVTFGVLAAALVWALLPDFRRRWPSFVLAWAIASACGALRRPSSSAQRASGEKRGYGGQALDELHQTFVPRRAGSAQDSLMDACGALAAVALAAVPYAAVVRWRTRPGEQPCSTRSG